MASGGPAIRGGQKQQAVEAKGLERRLNQRPRRAEGIKVDEIEPVALNNRPVQQQVCGICCEPSCTLQPLHIGLDQRQPIWIPIVDPELCLNGRVAQRLQPPAQGPDPATGHQIKPAQGLRGVEDLVTGQQHRQVPGRTRLGPEKAWAKAELSQTFAIVMIG